MINKPTCLRSALLPLSVLILVSSCSSSLIHMPAVHCVSQIVQISVFMLIPPPYSAASHALLLLARGMKATGEEEDERKEEL